MADILIAPEDWTRYQDRLDEVERRQTQIVSWCDDFGAKIEARAKADDERVAKWDAEKTDRLRDAFAVAIITGQVNSTCISISEVDQIAADVWMMADAMLKARGR